MFFCNKVLFIKEFDIVWTLDECTLKSYGPTFYYESYSVFFSRWFFHGLFQSWHFSLLILRHLMGNDHWSILVNFLVFPTFHILFFYKMIFTCKCVMPCGNCRGKGKFLVTGYWLPFSHSIHCKGRSNSDVPGYSSQFASRIRQLY